MTLVAGSQKHLFEIPSGLSYLNCASVSPQLRAVSAAGAPLGRKATPWLIRSADWFGDSERLRGLAGRILNASAEAIALIPASSYGIAIAAANAPIRRGQNIVLMHEEYPSNYYAWQRLTSRHAAAVKRVRRESGQGWAEALIAAIDADTAVVSVPACHWTDGSRVDLAAVGARARAVGAVFVVDASQSLGAEPLDVAAIQPDFLVAVGYKWLLGPYSLSYLYAAPKWCEIGEPIEHSWLSRADAEDFARLVDYRDGYRPGARRFDMGQFPNFVLTPMAIAALEQLLAWGVTDIRAALAPLTARFAAEARTRGFEVPADHSRVAHMLGLRWPGGLPRNLGERMAAAGVYIGLRGDAIRISPHLYNDEDDVQRFFETWDAIA